jgi:hypothetical protein
MLRQPCQRRQPGPQSPAPRPRGRQRSSCLRTRHGASHCKWGGKGGEGGGVRGGGWHSGRIKCAFGKRTTYTMEARDFAPALREAAAIAAADALRATVSPSAPSKAVRGASYADIGAESQGAVKSLEWRRRGAKKKKKSSESGGQGATFPPFLICSRACPSTPPAYESWLPSPNAAAQLCARGDS